MRKHSSNVGRRGGAPGQHSSKWGPTTRADREAASRRAKERERKRRYREVVRAAGSVPGETPDQRRRRMEKIRRLQQRIKGMQRQVEKLKGSTGAGARRLPGLGGTGGAVWRRPQDLAQAPTEPRPPLTAEQEERIQGMEPTAPEAPAPVLPAAPAPEPEETWEGGVDPERMAKDRERCDRAAREAIAADERTMERLMQRDPDVAPCRLCGEPDGLREHCWVCERCYQSRAWPFFNDPCPVDTYDLTIHAILDARARRKVTRIKSPCSVEGCENKVPTPEGIRKDATCDRCYGILEDEAGLDRRSLFRKKF